MSLAEISIEKRAVTYFVAFFIVVGGIGSFFSLGQLEDPDFTVKTGMVVTAYPGASPEEVELEVTDRLEQAIQELPQLDRLYSISKAGLSLIRVEIKQAYWADRLPQVWDEMRKEIRDILPTLPPGAQKPQVMDDFNFVYGFVLAIVGDGFTYKELETYAKELKRDLSVVPGVARAALWGVQDKVVYVDVSEQQLATLGLTGEDVALMLRQQNTVVDAGSIDVQRERLRVAPTGEFTRVEEIGNLTVRATLLDKTANLLGSVQSDAAQQRSSELIRIRDVATVRSGYLEPPRSLMRFNGQPALALSLANVAGGNIVETGRAIDARLQAILPHLPVGIEIHKIAWQSDLVSQSIQDFMINLAEAVIIVLIVLTVPMGWRMGITIGGGLVLTILGTFIFLAIFGIDLQRMSLGALVISLGMMVDNAIVVSDGISVRFRRGMDRRQAAIESASGPSWPLLGATVVAVMAFYPIFASPADAGEYCRTLFIVVAIALLLSWLLAMTMTPVQCLDLLKVPASNGDEDAYSGRFYQGFRGLLEAAIRFRWPFMAGMVVLFILSIYGFGYVQQMFFPDASRSQFMIDYWAPEGTRIQQVSADLKAVEAKLLEHPRVKNVSTFIGMGPPRFYLPVDPESPYASYAQLVVNTQAYKDVDALVTEIEPWLQENAPQALARVRKFGVGPSDTWKFEARFSGPANADLAILRRIGEEGIAILENSPLAKHVRTDTRQRVKTIVPEYDQERGRWAAVSRTDIADATRRAYDGLTVGLYREQDDLYPIILRNTEQERRSIAAHLSTLQVRPALAVESVPLSQVTRDIRVEWEDPIIVRWNRRRAVTVQGSPHGVTFPTLQASVLQAFEAIETPAGYDLFWDGEYDSTARAQASLVPGLIPAGAVMLLIIVVLFNAYRSPLIILCTIPFALIGITLGLLVTGQPFGFLALLGAMSLAGMMIKNAVVLLDQINAEIAEGKTPYQGIVDSAVSRLRPVVLGAATTVLGVAPLLQDVFWVAMAVTVMFGLAFGTILTMVMVPVLYACFYRVQLPQR
ncbi:MAG: efflux RND transporter permease subunit [Candidatus Tectomicrobia bacterium]